MAAEHDRIAAVRQLLTAPQSAGSSGRVVDIDVDVRGPYGCTPLMLAAHSGARQCTAALLEAGNKIGLGTDVAGGYSHCMLDSVRHAVTTNLAVAVENNVRTTLQLRVRPGQRRVWR